MVENLLWIKHSEKHTYNRSWKKYQAAFFPILSILYSFAILRQFKPIQTLSENLNTIFSELLTTQCLCSSLLKSPENVYIDWLIKLDVERKRWVSRNLRENAIEHCVNISLDKNVFKPSAFFIIVLKIEVCIIEIRNEKME